MNAMSVDSTSTEQALCERFEKCFSDGVNADEHLVWRGRFVTADFVIQIGSVPFFVRIENGRIKEHRKGPPRFGSIAFFIKGTAEAWGAFWDNPPKPKWHDIFALSKFGHMTIEGNLHPFMCNLQYFKDVLAVPRKGAE
jgi:hypothetical protein